MRAISKQARWRARGLSTSRTAIVTSVIGKMINSTAQASSTVLRSRPSVRASGRTAKDTAGSVQHNPHTYLHLASIIIKEAASEEVQAMACSKVESVAKAMGN